MKMPHPDWKEEPQPASQWERIYSNGRATDKFVAYLWGIGVDDKRYCWAVEVTGRMMPLQATQKQDRALSFIRERGPSVCKVVDGGDLPQEADQPPIG